MVRVERFGPMTDELEEYYSTFDDQSAMLREGLTKLFDGHEGDAPMKLKVMQTRFVAEKSDVKVFRFYPFWHQFTAGRVRTTWGGLNGACGGYYMHGRFGGAMESDYGRQLAPDREKGFMHGWNNPTGHDHHALCCDDILALGLNGLKDRVLAAREGCTEPEKLAFYDAAAESLDVLSMLGRRFADEAKRLLETETDPAARENLARIADAASRVPMEPPKTFYEALASNVFCRECDGTLEGIGISTYGQLDRMLYPYYKRDLEAGVLTEDGAVDLIEQLLLYTAVRFQENTAPAETSTTVILGGCDADGNVVYNDLTKCFIRAELEARVANVKYDCRISKRHPKEYIEGLCSLQLAGLAMLVYLNDDTLIDSRVKHGQDVRDARLYVAGGCHEIVLGGSEVCTRADTWIGLPALFVETLRKRSYDSFDELFDAAIADVKAYHERLVSLKNAVEVHWPEYNPMPLYSTMMRGCIEKGLDVTAGGSKYASTALSMVAPANFIDSMYAVKVLCFDEKKLTIPEFLAILDKNYEGEEPLRQYILNRLPKHCGGDPAMDEFSKKVLHALSGVSGQTNGRGGKYYPAFYPHSMFIALGDHTGATPDGRKAGQPLSRGVSPSEFLTGITPAEMLRSSANFDYTEFTDSFALEMTLPKLPAENGMAILTAIVERFLDGGGSSLQFNILDTAELIEAQKNPDAHRDILVRVCGYSFYFVCLSKQLQDEVIARAKRQDR